jgi:hypothetical protein
MKTIDLNRDKIPDLRCLRKPGHYQLRTADGWVSFTLFPEAIVPPRWVNCSDSKDGRHAVMFIRGDDGLEYKFCVVEDTCFSVYQGSIPKAEGDLSEIEKASEVIRGTWSKVFEVIRSAVNFH